MSLSDNDTTIVAGLADAGQRMTSLSSNIGLPQALLGDVSNTVMDPGTAVAGTMPCMLSGSGARRIPSVVPIAKMW